MQTDKSTFQRVFYASPIDAKEDVEEKLDKARIVLQRLTGNGSERETHDALQTAVCRDKGTHDDIALGLLSNILTDASSASKCFRDMTLISRDMTVVVDLLVLIAVDKYHKLTDTSRPQLIWIAKELVRASITGADNLCWNLMRQIAGGDISNRNLWLAENMLELYLENRSWLEKHPVLIASVIFTYLRILEDHFPTNLSNLKQKEVNFIVSLIRDNFSTVCLNPGLGMGRDFVRLLQGVSRIPEIQSLWVDLFYNPRSLSPHLTGITQLLNVRTSRKFLQSRLTPEMEKKIAFLTTYVKFGMHKRYQEWFQRQFLATAESQTLRADIIRFIVGVIHPPNEILCSDILPRWAVIGWLLTTCTNPVAAANAKLALFFDWLLFDPIKDNIMNIEPGILVMYHSIRPHLAITATLLDFLIRLTGEFWPGSADKIKDGVGAAFRTILEKKVLQSLDPVLENPKLEPELRNSIQGVLMPLIKRDMMPEHPVITISGGGAGGNNNNGHSDGPETMNLSYSTNTTPSVALLDTNHLQVEVPHHQSFVVDPEFSDDDDEVDDEEEDDDEPSSMLVLTGSMPRGSPTMATSAEEAEKSKVFDLVQMLPTNIRMPLDRMMSDPDSNDRGENLEEILEECTYQMDKDQREALVKALVFIYKSELNSMCVNEELNSLSEDIAISPVAEILDALLIMKPSDKSAKSKNLFRILSDIVHASPKVGYKILLILYNFSESPDGGPAAKRDYYQSLYKNLCTYRALKVEQALLQDVKACWESEPVAVGFLCPIIYDWYAQETLGSTNILRLVVSTIDSSQLQDIVWRVAQGDFVMIDASTDLLSTITKSLEWETWEQHCVWTILDAHQFDVDEYLPVITMLDYQKNSEALTALFLKLKEEKPTDKIMGPCLCRKPNPKDRFVMSLLICWSESEKDTTAEVLTQLLVKACGSPVKRKRGVTSAGRGTSSPAGPVTPNVENVLAHLDLLRSQIQDSGIFSTDNMQAALLQVQSWVTETQRNKYKDLLGMCAMEEETETKEQRGKRTVSGRKLPSSPTGSGGGGGSSNSVSGGGGEGVPTGRGSNLSRTRSGRTRQTIKDGSDSSSGDDDDEPISRPRNAKKRRKTSALNSDSD